MSADNNVLNSLLTGLPQTDKVELLHSIESAREVQIEEKLHPRRRRRRNADGVLESPADDASLPD